MARKKSAGVFVINDQNAAQSQPLVLPPDYIAELQKAQDQIGKRKLTDEELLVLASLHIARTHTFEEKGYLQNT
jgi:hypothetical protein